jgi:hypothetical protein
MPLRFLKSLCFSTVGANATYLHVNGATKSQIESGTNISVIPMTLMVIFDKGILAIAVKPLLIWEPMSLADCQMIKAHLLFRILATIVVPGAYYYRNY